jgi:hypothetical protein
MIYVSLIAWKKDYDGFWVICIEANRAKRVISKRFSGSPHVHLIVLEHVLREKSSKRGLVKPTETWAALSDLVPDPGSKPKVEDCDGHPESEDVANYNHDEHEVCMNWNF